MILRVFLFCVTYVIGIHHILGKTCQGVTEWNYHQYELLSNMLINCTKISGSLVLYRLRPEHDLSFLDYLEEITGYLVISHVTRPTLRLPALRYIRGWELYEGNALAVTQNYDADDAKYTKWQAPAGLRFLEFPSLIAIAGGGNVSFTQNPAMCYGPGDISWEDLFTPTTTSPYPQRFGYVLDPALTLRREGCESADGPKCPEECAGGRALYGTGSSYSTSSPSSYCWSPSTCQITSRTGCSPKCHPWARCTGPEPWQCCSPQCLGLCTGPGEHECLGACRNYRYVLDAAGSRDVAVTCVQSCPKPLPYDALRRDKIWSEQNSTLPSLRYNHDCVTHCPAHHVIYDFSCLTDCPPGYEEEGGQDTPLCLPCSPGLAPCRGHRSCPGVDLVTPSNMASFEGCTRVKGGLALARPTFTPSGVGGAVPTLPSYEQLERYFGAISVITGSLRIEYLPPYIESLGFFRNLTEILGRTLALPGGYALWIKNTQIKYIGLSSLKTIRTGKILLSDNPDLCYAGNFDWDVLFNSSHAQSPTHIEMKSLDRVHMSPSQRQSLYSPQCRDKLCHSQCSPRQGCWGPGSDNCLACLHYSTPLGLCVPHCREVNLTYLQPNHDDMDRSKGKCLPCHSECSVACSGPGPGHCLKCQNFVYQNACVPLCPLDSYPLGQICRPCHDSCLMGCTGPENIKGQGGCNHCAYGGIAIAYSLTRCNSRDVVKCPSGFYPQRDASILPQNTTTSIYVNYTTCRPCHPYCGSCTDGTITSCKTCKHYRDISNQSNMLGLDSVVDRLKFPCIFTCPASSHYQTWKHFNGGEEEAWCTPCSKVCKGYGCTGPRDTDCSLTCSGYKLFHGNSSTNQTQKISCHVKCPDSYKAHISNKTGEKLCILALPLVDGRDATLGEASAGVNTLLISVLGTLGTLLIVFASVIARARIKKKRSLPQEGTARLVNPIYGTLDSQSILMSGRGPEYQPLSPTSYTELTTLDGANGGQCTLNVIKYSELTFGDLLGFGAFGTVHKGLYTCPGAEPEVVAIKTIRNQDLGSQCREVFQEIELLYSVRHPCLLTVIGFCMHEYLIVTEYVPFGSLLCFLQNSQQLQSLEAGIVLTWAQQIARGMAYLESQSIVHRDLAARNVLVKSMQQVVISDFGSARMLGLYDSMYKSSGGKLPFKWLAIESINTLVFTHKSDVWSYGVTLWELLTSGAQPYKGIHNTALANMLEAGHRLPQPPSCSTQFYDLLLLCWDKDANGRPCFRDIQRILDHFLQNPNQHIFPLKELEAVVECYLNQSPRLGTNFATLLKSDTEHTRFNYVNGFEGCKQPYDQMKDSYSNNPNCNTPSYYNIINKSKLYSSDNDGGQSVTPISTVQHENHRNSSYNVF